jgi:hypothetical protein
VTFVTVAIAHEENPTDCDIALRQANEHRVWGTQLVRGPQWSVCDNEELSTNMTAERLTQNSLGDVMEEFPVWCVRPLPPHPTPPLSRHSASRCKGSSGRVERTIADVIDTPWAHQTSNEWSSGLTRHAPLRGDARSSFMDLYSTSAASSTSSKLALLVSALVALMATF